MTHQLVANDNPNEGMSETVCTVACFRKYAGVYEIQSDGSPTKWWTHSCPAASPVYTESNVCQNIDLGFKDPLTGVEQYAHAPQLRQPDPNDYHQADGRMHYYLGASFDGPGGFIRINAENGV